MTLSRDIYAVEEFTEDEAQVLRRYFTNVDKPVFALKNLPEVVKGALFARYSRTHLSLRRLFLDEFADDVESEGQTRTDDPDITGVGLQHAQELYDRVFFDYGDDSVAQLGGVHLACEQSSNLLTKVLEWGRIMSYLEQSTRYIVYDQRISGRYRFFRPPELMKSPLAARYVGDMDRMFDDYSTFAKSMNTYFAANLPRNEGESELAHRRAVRAKALDAIRGVLPAATLSNVGIYGSGQGYEALLLRMRAHPLPEVRNYSDLMLAELRKIIPSFLRRVDVPDRGVVTSRYLQDNAEASQRIANLRLSDPSATTMADADIGNNAADSSNNTKDTSADNAVRLLDFDPDGEDKMIAAMLYPHSSLPEHEIAEQVANMTPAERMEIVNAYCGERTNRRHKPGRALERTSYRFEVLSDYGAFRDLQRHRMLTIDWQPLSPKHGYYLGADLIDAGVAPAFSDAMERSAALYETLAEDFGEQAPYAVALAYRIRYVMQMNAREAMHMIELRTAPQGHPSYRWVCQQMHNLIANQAGHTAVAAMMTFVDLSSDAGLGRLQAEIRTEAKATAQMASNIRPHPNLVTTGGEDHKPAS